jgi:ATP-binding cassette, subfamily B, multidrug efflux pump
MLMQVTIDKYVVFGNLPMITKMSILLIIMLLLETAIRYLFILLTNWLGQQVIMELRNTIFKKAAHFNLQYFDTTPVGTVVARTITDVETINDVFSEGIISVLADLLSIIAVMTVMFYSNWQLALITLTVFPFLLIATYYFKESVNKSYQAERTQISNLYAFIQEHLSGMSIIQIFNSEKREFAKFKNISNQLNQANIASVWAYSVFFPIVEFLSAAALALVIWWGCSNMLQNQATPGLLLAFIFYINLLFRPLRSVADKFNTLQRGVIAGERIKILLEQKNEIKNDGIISDIEVKGKIQFDNISFSYIEGTPVLNQISFAIEPGKSLAIVGSTGSGKTSLTQLLCRNYEYQSGCILLDNLAIEKYDISFLRKNIGVVLQDVFLFSGSILDNITLYNPAISLQQVEDAAKLIGLHDFIMKLPNGYHQSVMERGNTLSLGQRQLISFLRAIIFNPAVLILDEATSSIESETEQLMQLAIPKLLENRTSIIIAHRLSTIEKADKIIVLEKGEIIETGTHQELLALKNHYYKLYHNQFAK